MSSILDAQYILTKNRVVHRIIAKWGISEDGRLAKPSEGGFGCITEEAILVDMWHALAYYKDLQEALDAREKNQGISFAFDRPSSKAAPRIRTEEARANVVEERLPQSSGGVRYAD